MTEQLNWTDVSVKAFSEVISIWMSDHRKKITLHNEGIIQSDENLNQNEQWREGECACFPQLRHPSFLALSHPDTWESSTIIQDWILMYWIIPLDFLALLLTDDISWDFSVSVRIWANSYNKSFFLIPLFMYSIGSAILENSKTAENFQTLGKT